MPATTLVDTQANAGKEWDFDTSQDATQGLMTTYKQYTASSGTVLRQVNYTWTQDSAGRNYIGRTQDVANPGTSSPATKQTDQALDQYGTSPKASSMRTAIFPRRQRRTQTRTSQTRTTRRFIFSTGLHQALLQMASGTR
jgi:hypothetical protein